MADCAMQEFVKESQERQSKFEANILAQLSQMMPSTPQSDVSNSNIKQNQIVLPQVVEQPKRQVDDHVPTVQKQTRYVVINIMFYNSNVITHKVRNFISFIQLKLFKYQLIKRHFHPSRMKVIGFKYSFYLSRFIPPT